MFLDCWVQPRQFQQSSAELSSTEFSSGVLCGFILEVNRLLDGRADAGWAPLLVIRAKDPQQKEMLEGTSPLAPGHLAKQGSKCSSMSSRVKDKDKDKISDKDKNRCWGDLTPLPQVLRQWSKCSSCLLHKQTYFIQCHESTKKMIFWWK